MRLLIESGFATAALSIADLCIFMAFPAQLYHIPLCDGLGNLHSITLLIIHNSRTSAKSQDTWDAVQTSLHFGQTPQNSAYGTQSERRNDQSSGPEFGAMRSHSVLETQDAV
ncbi:hypothetical protein GYMLUDRAFT_64637 [Collybiopsis luxurians FD-317 M1]|uniref:Uncharacterized protein n=1 Tax=Collybiopsis luxurians FD-317 M1 TaxID=944289 RepID=A0A0D0BQ37_9AGAR|nr:hypothetical protein GYMLUDRAFT_64637 [Collybiopsis luxurians FD-317 M1]